MVFPGNPRIEVLGHPGLYLLDPESGSGKTYLYSELKKIERYDNSVFTYTYGDYLRNTPIATNSEIRLAIADRADLYRHDTELLKNLYTLSKHAIVLTDIKNTDRLPYVFNFASVDFHVGGLEVYCGTFI